MLQCDRYNIVPQINQQVPLIFEVFQKKSEIVFRRDRLEEPRWREQGPWSWTMMMIVCIPSSANKERPVQTSHPPFLPCSNCGVSCSVEVFRSISRICHIYVTHLWDYINSLATTIKDVKDTQESSHTLESVKTCSGKQSTQQHLLGAVQISHGFEELETVNPPSGVLVLLN